MRSNWITWVRVEKELNASTPGALPHKLQSPPTTLRSSAAIRHNALQDIRPQHLHFHKYVPPSPSSPFLSRPNASTTELVSSLTPLHKLCWLRLSPTDIRFVIHRGDRGTQVWATVSISTLFDDYKIVSANNDIINLEVPLSLLYRALRSCSSAHDAILRLTKRATDGAPILCLTITTNISTLVTQEVPVRVLSAASVDGIREPEIGDADANIYLPPLPQVRGIAERMMKLAAGAGGDGKLVIGANWNGEFLMRMDGGDMVKVESRWGGLQNPITAEDDEEMGGGSRIEAMGEEEKARFREVRIDGREWVRLLKVGVLAKKTVACLIEGRALVIYVWLTEEGERDETVLTVSFDEPRFSGYCLLANSIIWRRSAHRVDGFASITHPRLEYHLMLLHISLPDITLNPSNSYGRNPPFCLGVTIFFIVLVHLITPLILFP